MTQQEREKIIKAALKRFGHYNQTEMMVEEASELIQAIQKHKRSTVRETKDHVCEELADVIIMTEQMRKVFGDKRIQEFVDMKLLRLYKRMNP